ncbi:hypothetical protein LEN26_018830 [Aphanomyces euteiches]|nr:hypothetical protein LEN26_018830 [Aphanomyces euteiches]
MRNHATPGGILLYETSTAGTAQRPSEAHTIRTDFTQDQRHMPHDNAESQASDRYYPLLADNFKAATTGAFPDTTPSTLTVVSSLAILVGGLVGIGAGVGLYFLQLGPEWIKLLQLPGTLFIRALVCLVLPLVFCVMTVVVAQMAAIGRSTIMRWQTIVPFAFTSIIATVEGFVLALLFRSGFHITFATSASSSTTTTAGAAFNLTLKCANGLFLASTGNNSLACIGTDTEPAAVFRAANQTTATTGGDLSMASFMNLVVGVAKIVVPDNIFASFASGALLSIVVFAVPLGIATAAVSPQGDEPNHILVLFRQLRDIFQRMLQAILVTTPVAVAFLIASSIANFDRGYTSDTMTQLGYLFVAFLTGTLFHSLVVLPLFVLVMTRSNPFVYFHQLLPAYLFAFGSASSLATVPMMVECINRAKISRAIAHVTMPFGTPVNLNGAGIYYPLAMVFMAHVAGTGDQWTVARFVVLFILSWIGSVATAPVPNGGILYLMILWPTCFPSTPMPPSFQLLFAADFIFDRICTIVNIHGNAAVTRILADQIDETFEVQAAAHV